MIIDRRNKVDFLQHVKGQDNYGEPIDEWVPIEGKTDIWSSKKPLLGNEFFSALTTESKAEVKFNTRHISGITNEMGIQHGTEIYEILSAIDVDSLHRELLCYCKLVK